MSKDLKKTTNPKTNAQPPETFTGLKVKKPKKVAGGRGAINSSVKHITEEMGLARGTSALLKMNQFTGFDCPGCAWPDPDDKRSLLGEYCENGAKALAEEATSKRVDPIFFAEHSVKDLGKWSDYELGKSGRLTYPMLLEKGATNYQPISWSNAFKLIGEKLNSLKSPDEAVFYTSGRTSNEAAFLYQLFVRMYGTNNLPDCSNMCHESSGVALSETLGIGKGSVTLNDLHEAEVIMVVGQNPGTNHPRMMTALQKCKKNGGKIISVNPLPETGLLNFKHPQSPKDLLGKGTELTDIFLQLKVNSDVALAKALLILLFEAEEKNKGEVFDWNFIIGKTSGVDELKEDLKTYKLDDLIAETGLKRQKVEAAAELLASKKKIIICWAMGLTQHENGVENIREYVNLLLVKGSIGKVGAGTCPVRGHSNVQGDRTMGIWEAPKEAFLDKLKAHFNFEPPRHHGLAVVPAIEAMHAGKAKVFIAMGGNFISATPDTEYTAEALRKCELSVHVSTKLNRSHIVHGERALILPCIARSEVDRQAKGKQFVSIENSMGVVQQSKGSLTPASDTLLSEPAIIAGMAKETLEGKGDWDTWVGNYDEIRNLIEACIPGFDNYNKRVRKRGGFYLPNGAREGKFNTSDSKAQFSLNKVPENKLDQGEYIMFTVRSHDQYNTTIYGLDDRYRGIYSERRVVLMNINDMNDALLSKGETVDLINTHGGVRRVAEKFIVVPFDTPRGCVATYFPEANVLVPINSFAHRSKTPASKKVIIRIEKRQA
ncbi:MAG: FdhF/YdeP family oxidoreductase [Bacteroidota bacterium]